MLRIRNNLKAKPIPFEDELFKSGVKKNSIDMNNFYSLPLRQVVQAPGTRYSVKLKDIKKE